MLKFDMNYPNEIFKKMVAQNKGDKLFFVF